MKFLSRPVMSDLFIAMTAVVSAYTAVVLVKLIPQALILPSSAQLAAANQALQQQIHDRELAEAQIQQLNEELEIRVAERTQELAASMFQVQNLAERMTLATDAAQMGVYDWNLITEKVAWNDYHTRLMGYVSGATEYSYADWERRVHPEDLPIVQAAIKLAMTDRTDYASEYRVVWEDGSIHWIDGFGRFYYDRDGQPIRMTGVIDDITDRKQSQQALQESEARYRSLIEATSQIIWNTNAEGELVIAQPSWGAFTGQSEVEYLGWGWLNAVHPDDRIRTRQLWSEALATCRIYEAEYRLRRHDGEYRHTIVRGVPIVGADGQVREWVGVNTDITDRIQAEAAIRESEDRFRITFEQAAIGVAHVGLAGQWLRVNQKLCEIVGYSEAELLDCTFQDITHPDDLATNLEYASQLIAGEIETYAMEKRYIHKLGTIVWVNLTVSLRRDAAGAPIHFISAVEKIDDRKRAEFALQEQTRELTRIAALVKQRNQELDQFAHIVSHDLKAPLRAIANLSSWIEDDLEGQVTSETQEHLELMRSRVDRMESMINGLLDYAKVGQTEASLSTFSVEDLLAETLDSLNIPSSFEIELPSQLPLMTSNRLLLSQVFANLLSNAYKHHDRPDGRIQITAQPQGEIWVFIVADDGPGIAPENQERVFGIFQTLAARDQQENTGIGLSIVKKIVENHGGNIVVESQLGHGTTFRFTWIVE
jgi:PAS domain S-box-containing protein